ncbi:MAG: DUF262 domain-containing protein [Candidatus Methanoperedenaceae archaeon]|nr:DUF262 domain-containing protein [Candidatus Methanoperedenaceae archaeon]
MKERGGEEMTENPGTESVEKLLESVHDGSYVIPHFQRGFEWRPRMVCDLIESILQKYYTGLILLWELRHEESQKEEWEPVWGVELKDNPKNAILDGQQRLGSLYYAIYNPKKTFPKRDSYYLFYLDLIKVLNEEYEGSVDYYYYNRYYSLERIKKEWEDWIKDGEVPLVILSMKDPNNPHKRYIDTKEFYDWSEKFVKENSSKLPENITPKDVIDVFSDILTYPFVFYPLSKTRKPSDVCNIFAKVNAKGMKLSTFDLMNAFLYPKGVKLRVELWENLDNDILKDVDSNMNEYLLKLISLIKQNYCSSKYIYKLIPGEKIMRKDKYGKKYSEILIKDGGEFKNLWNEACKYAEKSREIIMNTGSTDFGAIKTGFIPNTTIVPVLGAILWEYKGDPDDVNFKNNLKRWYWSAVLSEDYSGSSDTVMSKDFRDWKEWINNGKNIERINKITQEFIDELDLKGTEKGSARYNAILCILALNDAKDFYKGRIVGTGGYSNEKIDDHHIFPKQVKGLDPGKSKTFVDLKDSIVNKTLLLDETNNRILNKKPSQYIAEMIDKHRDEEEVKSILQGHLITEKAFEYMKEDDFDNFAIEREKAIKQHILSKMGMRNQE